MCGIAGILTAGRPVSPRDALYRMRSALTHRGPDDQGIYLSPNRRAALAHTRLSILDLSSAGHQPMSTPDGRFTITFNGEIYNCAELRGELTRGGISFHSRTDTEVILRCYERWGPACVEKLRGMFAFGIWDDRDQSCFLGRDPLGIKPLYYHHDPRGLLFASELRALMAAGVVTRRLNPSAAFGYFQMGSVPEPETLIAGVSCLPAGHTLLWRDGRITLRRFWSLRLQAGPVDGPEAVGQVREALLDSVRRHFQSDVPVGVFLSGGLDSTALVALATVAGKKDLQTFSISLEDSVLNEGDVARKTADHFGTRHADFRLDAAGGQALFRQFLGCLDQPSVDGFNTFAISRFASNHGMKVVLSGLGGDELFGGYRSFVKVPQLVRWSRKLEGVAPLRKLAGRCLEHYAPRLPWRRLGAFLQGPPTSSNAFRIFRGIYTPGESRAMTAAFAGAPPEHIAETFTPPPCQPTLRDDVSAMEIQVYMRNQLLRDSDVMSMASGLELRVPFVDRAVVETLARLPAQIRLEAEKRLLIRAVPEMPPWVLNRPKRTFAFPFEQWLAGDWKDLFADTACPTGVAARSWSRRWAMFVFKTWCSEMKIPLGEGLVRSHGQALNRL